MTVAAHVYPVPKPQTPAPAPEEKLPVLEPVDEHEDDTQ
jgi:hypothetical protein